MVSTGGSESALLMLADGSPPVITERVMALGAAVDMLVEVSQTGDPTGTGLAIDELIARGDAVTAAAVEFRLAAPLPAQFAALYALLVLEGIAAKVRACAAEKVDQHGD